jgi:Family of unknown function (DUF6349)
MSAVVEHHHRSGRHTVPPAAARAQSTSPDLWTLLATSAERRATWNNRRSDDTRLTMLAAWRIWITCPGDRLDGRAPPRAWPRCTATVLSRDTGHDANHLIYRGACLGCGWVSEQLHLIGQRGENGAAEDANDHAHPGWRDLPIVAPPPRNDGGTAYPKAVAAWRNRWDPILPAGWLDRGGPIRTQRTQFATRHVPGRAPGGGYDMSAGIDSPERPGGQLGLF